MKKVLCIFALVVLLSATAFAGITLPANKSVAKAGGGFTSDLKIGPEGTANKMSIAVPISMLQRGKGAPAIQLYMSIRKAGPEGWTPVSIDGQYAVDTKEDRGFAIAELNLEKGTYWIRIWGKFGDKWLLLNQASIYYRLDARKNGAYEIIASTETGDSMSVPTDLPAWN
ncbi:MAG: hypothetical protein WC349_00110 [Patescibacteria group bacterium]|jgi:hypothetical protein